MKFIRKTFFKDFSINQTKNYLLNREFEWNDFNLTWMALLTVPNEKFSMIIFVFISHNLFYDMNNKGFVETDQRHAESPV